MEKKQPLLVIRPAFHSTPAIVEAVLAGLVGTAVLVFLGATLLSLFFSLLGLGALISLGALFKILLVLGLAGLPPAYYEAKKKAWSRTIYQFHPDHMEYQDFKFLFVRRRGRVRLRDITDVYERANPLQARFMLTSLYFIIPGLPDMIARGISGLHIADVADNASLREKILDLIEASETRRRATPAPQVQPAAAI